MNTYRLFFKCFSITVSLLLSFSITAQEICNNGIDDDGDGLIDCYDTGDCGGSPSCANFYFGQPIPSCDGTFTPPAGGYNLVVKYETDSVNFPLDQRGSMYVQDMNNDGIPDLVGLAGNRSEFNGGGPIIGDQRNKVHVFQGTDGAHITSFDVPNNGPHEYSQVALGDVDNDDNGDIFVVNRAKRICRFEMGAGATFTHRSSNNNAQKVGSEHMSPQLADFDADGTPEVYVGNAIYNSLDLTTLVPRNNALNHGRNNNANGSGDSWPIAFDIDGDGDLELVAGNKVYDVDLVGGTLTERSFIDPADFTFGGNPATANQIGDGFTSVADLDGNGVVDVVVTHEHFIYAWEPSNAAAGNNKGTVKFQPVRIGNNNRAGRACIGDFTGDNSREIGVVGQNRFKLYDYLEVSSTVVELFSKTIDDASGRTGCTLFDFEGDGSAEIVYSDEGTLFIWDAAGNTIAQIPSESATRTDYPLVVDIDNDNQAEIVITSQHQNGPVSGGKAGYIAVYESSQHPWVSARRNWNQHGFFNTNVNVDGTIPTQQQSHIVLPDANSALNSFLSQLSVLDVNGIPIEPAPDLTIAIQNVTNDIDLTNCPGTAAVTLEICNGGIRDVNTSFPVSFYHNDPRSLANSPRFLGVQQVSANVTAGACISLTPINIPLLDLTGSNGNNDGSLYFVVNDSARGYADGDPLTAPVTLPNYPLLECDYSNNFHGPIDIDDCNLETLPIELGGFESTLENRTVRLDWMTLSELNNSHFIIQRSQDGASFTNIGEVAGNGTTTATSYYEFWDMTPREGVNYYRLKQVDYDGSYTYSKIVAEKLEGLDVVLQVYPNPAQGNLTLELVGRNMEQAQLKLVNELGQVVKTKMVNNAVRMVELDVEDLPRGVYHLLFLNQDGLSVTRSVVLN